MDATQGLCCPGTLCRRRKLEPHFGLQLYIHSSILSLFLTGQSLTLQDSTLAELAELPDVALGHFLLVTRRPARRRRGQAHALVADGATCQMGGWPCPCFVLHKSRYKRCVQNHNASQRAKRPRAHLEVLLVRITPYLLGGCGPAITMMGTVVRYPCRGQSGLSQKTSQGGPGPVFSTQMGRWHTCSTQSGRNTIGSWRN